MVSRKYRFWSAIELREAILALEDAMTIGAATTSYQGAGTVQWTSRENFEAILRDLNDAYDRIVLGETNAPAITQRRIYPRRGL
jgi:hypothetical protein